MKNNENFLRFRNTQAPLGLIMLGFRVKSSKKFFIEFQAVYVCIENFKSEMLKKWTSPLVQNRSRISHDKTLMNENTQSNDQTLFEPQT